MRPRMMRVCVFSALVALGAVSGASAQDAGRPPSVVQFWGTLTDANGAPRVGPALATFAVYEEATGGSPLWVETQPILMDARGAYSVLLGATTGGLPVGLFSAGSARWVGVQLTGEPELPRVMLTSVPYALKAGDAQTLGGLPPSAFLRSDAPLTMMSAPAVAASDPVQRSSRVSTSTDASGDGIEQPADVVTADDVIIQGSACTGLDCVNGEVFGFDTLRLKENNTRITFMDTSTTAGYSARDWRLRANESGGSARSAFFIDDLGTTYTDGAETFSSTPFTIVAGAPTNAFVLDSTGKLGLRTSSPGLDLHITTSDTPAHRFEQTNAGGYTAQTWDIGANEANFFVRDLTGGSRLSFRIRPGAPTSSIDIAASGNVGIGTASPAAKLHVTGDVRADNSLLMSSGAIGIRTVANAVRFDAGSTHPSGYQFTTVTAGTALEITNAGDIGVGTSAPSAKLEVNGAAKATSFEATTVRANTSLLFSNGRIGFRELTGNILSFDGGTAYPSGYRFATASVPSGAVEITDAGRVGIGVASPSYPLEMASGAYVTTGGTWTNASSRSLKDQIRSITLDEAKATVDLLEPVSYVYRADPMDRHVGFIAEDVPDLVATPDRKGLSPMDIVAVLTKVVQDQQQEIQALLARVAALENASRAATTPAAAAKNGQQ